MSVFDQTDHKETDQTTTQQQNSDGWLDRLVKEKGEQWKDPEVIAKGKIQADEHIRNLEEQLEEMRKDLGKQEYAKDLLSKLQDKAPPTAGGKTEVPNSGSTQDNTNLDASKLESLIEQTLTAREKKQTATQNIAETDQRLADMFGTEAGNVVKAKASELGMSLERLKEIASESPTAFFTLIGEAKSKETNSTAKSTLNTSAGFTSTSGERTNEFYQKWRREKPTEFWSTKVQKQMLDDRKWLGDKFYM